MYLTTVEAEEALIQAHINFNYGRTSGPIAWYKCEDCGYFHLTSKGPVNDKLLLNQKNGTIDKAKDAAEWERKLKRR